MRKSTYHLLNLLLQMGMLCILINGCKKEGVVTLPEVITTEITDITQTTATCGGKITSDGGAKVSACGICWSTGGIPTINDNKTTGYTYIDSFTSILTLLSPNTNYFVRAYATNSKGMGYGGVVSYTTLEEISFK
jgi:hypothetical protein